MTTRYKDFTGTQIPYIIDDEYIDCNFSQDQPVMNAGVRNRGVRLFPGDDTPRIFTHCNLINCEVPSGSIIDNCNTWIVERGVVTSRSTLRIGSQTIKIDHHSDFIRSKVNPETLAYDDQTVENVID